ncbi:hypothetical protein [Neisseria gonorrhoeae]
MSSNAEAARLVAESDDGTVAAMPTPAPIKDRNTPDTAFALPPSSLK